MQTGVAVGGHSAATGALDEGSYGFQAMYVAGDDPNHSDSAWSACEPFNVAGVGGSRGDEVRFAGKSDSG